MIATLDKKLINRKILEQNLKRFFYLPLIAIPISFGHILFFYFSLTEPDTIEFTWRWGIIYTHTLIIILSLFIGLLAYTRRKHHRPSDNTTFWLINILVLLVVLVGVAIAIIDQLVTPAITPFLVICTFVAVVFLIHPINALIMYLSSYGFLYYLLPLTQSNPEILLSNRVNGLSFIGIGFLISLILWRNNWSDFQQKIVIEEQNKALESNNIELKDQRLRLLELNATKDKFFSIIAHDLKSPFNSIMGFSELLVEQINKNDYDGIRDYARIILQSSQRAVDLLMNLMEWSRSQTGRVPFNPEPFDLNESIDDITALFDDIARQKGITIKNELPSKVTVFADRAMISTVLRNLISNAVKFTRQDGKIILAVAAQENRLTFSVKDNGIGIPKVRVEKLFHIEESESTPGTANEQGTGLGLILCKEFIEKHEGKIWAESDTVGKPGGAGSTFYFTLPYNSEPAEDNIVQQSVASGKNQTIRKLKILIAEDDEVSEMLLDNYINIFSKEILKVKTGEEAVEACRNHPDIDLILMDIRLPAMGGNEATRRIREFNNEVIIIAQTAYGLTGDREKSLEAGCNDYIAKPIKKSELEELIQKYFGK
jgi:signal transduction histidine kinase